MKNKKVQLFIRADKNNVEWLEKRAAESEPKISRSALANFAISQYIKYFDIIQDFKKGDNYD